MHELLGLVSIADCQFGTGSVLNAEKLAFQFDVFEAQPAFYNS